MKLKNNLRSYILVSVLGVGAGLLTIMLNLFPNDTLWSFSSIASAFGFWIITTTLVIYFSCSNINAFFNVFLYLVSMNFTFYTMQGILGLFLPKFHNVEAFINWGLLNKYNMLALFCAIISFVLYYWNRKSVICNILYALPIGGLGAEIIGVAMYLLKSHTYLFQLIINCLGMLLLMTLFYKKISDRFIFLITATVVSLLGAYLIYIPNLI